MIAERVVFRFAEPADLPAAAEFWGAMFDEIGSLTTAQFVSDWRGRFASYLRDRGGRREACMVLALDGERIVGTAGALLRDGYPAAIHGVRAGYIFGVRVEPAYRGLGVATRLTQACIEFLREIECSEIRLHASDAGRPIYERLGFTPTNEMRLA